MKDYSGKSSNEIVRDVENSRENLLKQIDQLQDQFQPEQLFNSAKTAFLNSDGAEFTRNMGRSLRDNPLPVALIGAGIAWLIAGQGGPTSRDLRDGTRRSLERFRSDGTENHQPDLVPTHIPSEARLASHDVKGREVYQPEFTDVDKGKDEPGRLSKAREKIGDAGTRASETVRSSVSRAGETVRGSVSNAGSAIGHGFDQGQQYVSDFAETAQQSVRNAYRSNPVVLGLGVAAAAALAGALLPNTRRENELLGEAADDLKQQGRELADQAVEKASHIADTALHTAQEEAEKRGYSRDNAEGAATKAIDDIRDIGAKTAQTVRDETEAAVSDKKPDSDRQA